MTCIIAIADKDSGKVYMAGDSAATNGWFDSSIVSHPKVFLKSPDMLIGYTGSFRVGQIMQYGFSLPSICEGIDHMQYMSIHFVNAMRQALNAAGCLETDNGCEVAEGNSCILVGWRGRIYEIMSGFGIIWSSLNYASVGSGHAYACGALYASDGLAAVDRLQMALNAASQFNAGVRGPFTILETTA